MKIGVKSAGIDTDSDYHWVGTGPGDVAPERYLRDLDKAYSAVAAAHGDGTYSVLMRRMRTIPEKRDARNRTITVSVYVSEIGEKDARALLIAYMRNRERVEQGLCCSKNVTIGESGFTVNEPGLRSAVSAILADSAPTGCEPVARGEVWGEACPLDRRDDVVVWLQKHRLGSIPGPRVICSHFLSESNIPPVDLALLVSGSGESYSRPVIPPSRQETVGKPLGPEMKKCLKIVVSVIIAGVIGGYGLVSLLDSPEGETQPTTAAPTGPAAKPDDKPVAKPGPGAEGDTTKPDDKPVAKPGPGAEGDTTKPDDKSAEEPEAGPAPLPQATRLPTPSGAMREMTDAPTESGQRGDFPQHRKQEVNRD